MTLFDEALERIKGMPEEKKKALWKEIQKDPFAGQKLVPNPGPQTQAYFCEADVLLYGGAGGGGKSALLNIVALTQHKRSALARRQYTDLRALIDEAIKFNGTKRGFNGAPPPSLRTPDGRLIEFIAAAQLGDEQHRQGQAIDFLGVDEAAHFLEEQVRFWLGWVRTTEAGQRCRAILASNPPLSSEGQWLVSMFAPWLDPNYPNPAQPGELRWVVTDDEGKDLWVDGPEPYELNGRKLKPLSRTFIPAALKDNPHLKDTGYEAQLDAMQEPMRSAVRDGNFMAAREDDATQICPSKWLFDAQNRWTPTPPNAPMSAIGVDIAQGGSNDTVLAPRYDAWFAKLITASGKDTPGGSDVVSLIVKHRQNSALPIIDVGGGYGGATCERLDENQIEYAKFNGSVGSAARTQDRALQFANKRAEAWWRFREALDPDQPGGARIALPPDSQLIHDLAAPRFETKSGKLYVESKKDIIKRLGRSPDRGDAVVMAWSSGPKIETHGSIWRSAVKAIRTPRVVRAHMKQKRFIHRDRY